MVRRPTFSELLRTARRKLGLTQGRLGELSAIPQSTISQWERKERLPGPSRVADLEMLSGLLSLDGEQLREALEYQRSLPHPQATPNTPTEFLRSQGEFLDAQDETMARIVGGRFVMEVWLLGAGAIPAVADSKIEDAWSENLLKGRNYKILWILDLSEPDLLGERLREAHISLTRIARTVEAGTSKPMPGPGLPGKILHYPTLGFSGEDTPPGEAIGSFPSLRNNLEIFKSFERNRIPGNRYLPFTPLRTAVLRRRLLQYCSRIGTVSVVSPSVFIESTPSAGDTREGASHPESPLTSARMLIGVEPWAGYFIPTEDSGFFFRRGEVEAAELRSLVVSLDSHWAPGLGFEEESANIKEWQTYWHNLQ